MRKFVLAVSVLVIASFVPVGPAAAVDQIQTGWFRRQVTVGGFLSHARALQRIANRNGGTRASGTPGFEASAEYVKGRLEAAGYEVTEQEFTFPFSRERSPAELDQLAPAVASYETSTLQLSGSGDVTGVLVPTTDVQIPPAGASSGCEPADFVPASPDEPQVALVQRGTCTLGEKVVNAEAAGYDAVVLFNEGVAGRVDVLTGRLTGPAGVPVVGLGFADGAALYAATQAGPVTMRVFTDNEVDLDRTTSNIIADTPGGDPDKVLVVGAHLDSVLEGPGINDNGSGVAVTLEVAEELAEHRVRVRQKVRFAFWGGEESGLLGSEHYVDTLSDAELGTIFANLNFDMLGSPNYVRFVYDGDGRPTSIAGPPGSGRIETVFNDYFASQDLPVSPLILVGRTDYQPFFDVGIPIGGLFSGAELPKSRREAEIYGGTALEPYDPNYHEAGDTIANLNTKALHELGDGVAHGVLTLARTTTGFFEDGSRAAPRRAAVDREEDQGPDAVR
jgi:Zn-dependent M28 family amino/carboxypeptidase